MVPSIWQVPGPCCASWPMALDSDASPSSASVLPSPLQYISHIFMQRVGLLRDTKLACFPTVWKYSYSLFFFLSEIIYCWWKIWDQNLYKIVSFLHGANVRPPCTHPVASPYYLRAVLLQITVCQFISLVPGPFSVAKLTDSRTIYFLLSKGLAIMDIYKHWGPVQRHRHVVTEPTAKKQMSYDPSDSCLQLYYNIHIKECLTSGAFLKLTF